MKILCTADIARAQTTVQMLITTVYFTCCAYARTYSRVLFELQH